MLTFGAVSLTEIKKFRDHFEFFVLVQPYPNIDRSSEECGLRYGTF